MAWSWGCDCGCGVWEVSEGLGDGVMQLLRSSMMR